MRKPVSPELLRHLIRYEPETGRLYWQPREVTMFHTARDCAAWNARYAGAQAFTSRTTGGYFQGSIFGFGYYAHRVAWAIQTAAWPAEMLDHADGDRANNKWENLREATNAENQKNRRSLKGSRSKYLGVSWGKSNRAWQAQITVDGRRQHLGYFASEIEAAGAYDVAARQHFGEFANPNLDHVFENYAERLAELR